MNWKHVWKRIAAAVLGVVMTLGLCPELLAQVVEAADFELGSGFTDPAITVTTMYYWKEGLPPVKQNADGKTAGSTIGVEYPTYITWGGDDFTRYFFKPSTYEIEDSQNGRVHRAYENPSHVYKDESSATVNVNKDTDDRPHGLPPSFLVQWRGYTSSVGGFSSLDIAKALSTYGVAAGMSVDTNLYLVPAENGTYAFEIDKGSNKWIVGEHHTDAKKRKSVGYETSLDWHLDTYLADRSQWTSAAHMHTTRESTANKMEGDNGYNIFELGRRTWTFSNSGGKYSIGSDGVPSWYLEDWTSTSQNDWRTRMKNWLNGSMWEWTEFWLSHQYHFGIESCLETWGGYRGDWSHAQANQDGRYLFRVFYGEPNIVSFIQTDTKVQDGQVVNLDGPIVIGQNATITVESGGVLVVSGWVMNGGYIMVKPGGMLIVQDQERLDGTHQYGVINCFKEEKNKKYGRISCDGIMIVNRDCKVFGAGAYGIQFGEGAQCTNYGQLVSENFEVYSDHTIENRGDTSAVFAGWGLNVGGFVMANQRIDINSDTKWRGNIESTCAVNMAKDAVYGPGANRVYINSASRVKSKTNLANRKGNTTEIDATIMTYKPVLDTSDGVYYLTDSEGFRYDYYNGLRGFARFEKDSNGNIVRYDFGGRYAFESDAKQTPAAGVPDYDKSKEVFFLVDGSGTRYEYNLSAGGFVDVDALTNIYYPGMARFPKGVKGFSVTRNGSVSDASLADGSVYFIESCIQSDKLIDVASSSLDDGGNVHLWSKHGGANQQWKLQSAGSEKKGGQTINYYKIINVNSGKALSIDGSSYSAGVNIAQYTERDNGDHQKWRLISSGDGFTIVPKSNPNVCIDVNGGSPDDGTNIMLWNVGSNQANQRWRLIPVSTADLNPSAAQSNTVTKLEEGVHYSIVPAGNVSIRIDPKESYADRISLVGTSNATQWFVLEEAANVSYGGEPRTYYYIKVDPDFGHQYKLGLNPNDGYHVGVNSKVNIYRDYLFMNQLSDSGKSANQWYIAPAGDGSFYLQPAHVGDDYGLGVQYGYKPNAGLSLAIQKGDNRVKWKFVKE